MSFCYGQKKNLENKLTVEFKKRIVIFARKEYNKSN